MNLQRVADYVIPSVEHAYTARDTMLYALGLGYGSDPLNLSDLKFVYEQGATPLQAVPSMAVILSHPGFWARDPHVEIDWVKILHGEQSFEIHRPLPAEGAVRGEVEIVAVEDKGPDKGCVVHQKKTLFDLATGEKVATVTTVLFMRGDGGFGGFGTLLAPPEPLPQGEPDRVLALTTLPQSGLIYRLNGDWNPIHADPAAAEKAGLGKPILHGLCTLGIATRAAIDALAGGDSDRLKSMSVRFSRPVYPGETIQTEFYGDGPEYRFRARVLERDVVVLDRGTVRLG